MLIFLRDVGCAFLYSKNWSFVRFVTNEMHLVKNDFPFHGPYWKVITVSFRESNLHNWQKLILSNLHNWQKLPPFNIFEVLQSSPKKISQWSPLRNDVTKISSVILAMRA